MIDFSAPPSPLQLIEDDFLLQKKIKLYIKRDDLLGEQIQGNKWRKLKYNLIDAHEKGYKKLLTFGGAWSNHIYATAAAGNRFGFETYAVIRGEKPAKFSNTLLFAKEMGMQFFFVSRSDYKEKNNATFLEKIKKEIGHFYPIPEGGTTPLALMGCKEMVAEIQQAIDFDVIATGVGTGGTLAGIVEGLSLSQQAIGFSSLKGDDTLSPFIQNLISKKDNKWEVNFDYHFGGYAKTNPTLIEFIKALYQKHQIQFEPIYNGKMMYGLYDLIHKDYFAPGTTIVAVHTGGLQGLRGFKDFV